MDRRLYASHSQKETILRSGYATLLALLLGLGLAALLVWLQGPDTIMELLISSGWALLAISLFRFLPLAIDSYAWNRLFPPAERRSFLSIFQARWIGESVNTLLPVAQIGGDVVRARLAKQASPLPATRPPQISAGASVVVDFLLGLLTQALFTLIGIACLALYLTRAEGSDLLPSLILIACAGLVGILLLYSLLRTGGLARIVPMAQKIFGADRFQSIADSAETLNQQVSTLLSQRKTITLASFWKLLAWLMRSLEIWIILSLMGSPVTLAEAIIIESLASAVRSAAFIVPGAVGVQEGGIIAIAALLGLPTETALAVALLRRGRELMTSLPGLIAWSLAERGALKDFFNDRKTKEAHPFD